MKTWRCIADCGACCHLDPQERPGLETYLTPQELELYFSMVGEDGWCVHFDSVTRRCRIYEERPGFCRVQPESFERRYGVSPQEFDEFAIECCEAQIAGVYGEESEEMRRYGEEQCQ
jgi:Fe-S-cluster containining protein